MIKLLEFAAAHSLPTAAMRSALYCGCNESTRLRMVCALVACKPQRTWYCQNGIRCSLAAPGLPGVQELPL